MELGAPVEICGCELGTVPRQGDPPREVGRDIMATGINITADLNRGFTGPPSVSADSPIFPSQSGQPDFPELLPNRNGLIVPHGLGLAWGGSILKSSRQMSGSPCHAAICTTERASHALSLFFRRRDAAGDPAACAAGVCIHDRFRKWHELRWFLPLCGSR